MPNAESIRSFIRNNMAIYKRGASFSDDDQIFQLGFVDSMVALKLVTFLEMEFGIRVEDDDLNADTFSTVNAIVAFVERKSGAPVAR